MLLLPGPGRFDGGDVVPTPVVNTEIDIDADQLWVLSRLLAPDWGSPMRVTTNWQTDVEPSGVDGEQRRGLVTRPARTVEYLAVTLDLFEISTALGDMRRRTKGGFLCPMPTETRQVTAATAAGSRVLTADFTNRRVYSGQLVALLTSDESSFDVARVESVTSGSITLEAPLEQAFDVGGYVIPLIQAQVELDIEAAVESDEVILVPVRGEEIVSGGALPALYQANMAPPGFQLYEGFPVLSGVLDYGRGIDLGIARAGSFSASGRAEVVEAFGDRGRWVSRGTMVPESRASGFDLLRLFDSRAGRVFPFWSVSPVSEFNIRGYTASGVIVDATGPEIDWEQIDRLAQVQKDGTVAIRRVVSVQRSADQDTVQLDAPFDDVPLDARLTVAFFSRFTSDAMVEEWVNLETFTVDVAVTEIDEATSVTIPNLTAASLTAVSADWDSSLCDYVAPDPGCDESCVECGCCTFSLDSTVTLDFSSIEVSTDPIDNGLTHWLAAYLSANGPYVLTYLGQPTIDGRRFFEWALTIPDVPDGGSVLDPDPPADPDATQTSTITLRARFDCVWRQWRWGYTVVGNPLNTARLDDFTLDEYEPIGSDGETKRLGIGSENYQRWNNFPCGSGLCEDLVPCGGFSTPLTLSAGIVGSFALSGRSCCQPGLEIPVPQFCVFGVGLVSYSGWMPSYNGLGSSACDSCSPINCDTNCFMAFACPGPNVPAQSPECFTFVGCDGDPPSTQVSVLEEDRGRLCYSTNFWETRSCDGESWFAERILLRFADGSEFIYTGSLQVSLELCGLALTPGGTDTTAETRAHPRATGAVSSQVATLLGFEGLDIDPVDDAVMYSPTNWPHYRRMVLGIEVTDELMAVLASASVTKAYVVGVLRLYFATFTPDQRASLIAAWLIDEATEVLSSTLPDRGRNQGSRVFAGARTYKRKLADGTLIETDIRGNSLRFTAGGAFAASTHLGCCSPPEVEA